MAVGISNIKSEAKASLNDKWVIAIVSSLTILFAFLIVENIAWVLSVALGNSVATVILLLSYVFLIGPLILGVLRHFWRMHGGLEETPATAFYYFSAKAKYTKSVRLCIKIFFRILLAYIIFNLPAAIVAVVSSVHFFEFLRMPIPMWSQNLGIVHELLSTVGAVLTWLSAIRFYLAPILVIANEEIDVDEAIHMSSVISKNSLADLIFLILSLSFWIVISLIFYIPLVFTLPYMLMCYIVHSLGIINAYNEKIKKLNDEFFPSFVAGA